MDMLRLFTAPYVLNKGCRREGEGDKDAKAIELADPQGKALLMHEYPEGLA